MTTKRPGVVITQARDLPLTVFLPKEDQKNYGIFEPSNPDSKVQIWMRVGASHPVNYDTSTEEWENQWGQVVAFDGVARKIANILNNAEKDHVNLRVFARQEMTPNIQNNEIYLNVVWVVWGFEHDGVFYTTQDGKLVQGEPTLMRGTRKPTLHEANDTLRRREYVKGKDSRYGNESVRPTATYRVRG